MTVPLFGGEVAVDADTAVVVSQYDEVGSHTNQGSAQVFTRSGQVWTPQQKLVADDGASFDYFGIPTVLDGDRIVVGMYNDTIGANADQGSAYVFERSGTVWSQTQHLIAPDGDADDSFGYSVSLDADTLTIGADVDELSGTEPRGAVYVYLHNGATFGIQQKLVASNGATEDYFGNAVAVGGDFLLVGAPGHNVAGAIYFFGRQGSTWQQLQFFSSSDGIQGEYFGSPIALSGRSAIVGVGVSNNYQGAAYLFDFAGDLGDACTENAHCKSGFCADGVCCETACGDSTTADCVACSANAGAPGNGFCKPVPNGEPCDDGNMCTIDACVAGVCEGTDTCGQGGAGGDANTGGATSSASVAGVGGAATPPPPPEEESGCDCRAAGSSGDPGWLSCLLAALLLFTRTRMCSLDQRSASDERSPERGPRQPSQTTPHMNRITGR